MLPRLVDSLESKRHFPDPLCGGVSFRARHTLLIITKKSILGRRLGCRFTPLVLLTIKTCVLD